MLSLDEAQNANLQNPHEEGKEIQFLLARREEVSKNALTSAMKCTHVSTSSESDKDASLDC